MKRLTKNKLHSLEWGSGESKDVRSPISSVLFCIRLAHYLITAFMYFNTVVPKDASVQTMLTKSLTTNKNLLFVARPNRIAECFVPDGPYVSATHTHIMSVEYALAASR